MTVWVLNLDAEAELAHPGGGAYTTPARVKAQLRKHAARFVERLPAGDRVLDGPAPGESGEAWCPTPSALQELRRAGASVGPSPALDVLRRVNGRAFALSIEGMEEDRLCRDRDALEAALARPGDWLLKRELSFAGRGHRKVHASSRLDEHESWVHGALSSGPVLVTRLCVLSLEVGLHGRLSPDGDVTAGALTVQSVDPHGQHLGSELAGPGLLTDAEHEALERAFTAAAAALHAAGYFGPFGVDAFRHSRGFHPLSDLNARYSMGWPVGMRSAETSASPRGLNR